MDLTCPIWGTPASKQSTAADAEVVLSPRAGGAYRISRTLAVDRDWRDKTERDSAKVTSWLVAQRAAGEPYPILTTYVFEEVKRRPSMSIQARRDSSLKMLASRSQNIGQQVRFFGAVDDLQKSNV